CGTRAVGALLLLGASVSTAPARLEARPWMAADAQEPPRAPCCFTNAAYSGTCEVTPAQDETCAQILDYLNNPMSQGKSYCGGTNIRGGWQSVACPAPE
ncbi:MAG TPA: hypothetical protein VII13_11685, partial [Vicinamibacteria bacterium]